MAKIVRCGFETQGVGSATNRSNEGEGYIVSSSAGLSYTADAAFSGDTGLDCASTNTPRVAFQSGSYALDRDYFVSFRWRRRGGNSATVRIFEVVTGAGASCGSLRWQTDETIRLFDASGNAVGTAVATTQDQWHTIEIRCNIASTGTPTWDWRVDDSAIDTGVSLPTNNTVHNRFLFGHHFASGAQSQFDDVRINDDQGGADDTYAAYAGELTLLVPTALGSGGRGNWTAGGGGTSDLHEDVNNRPPTGTTSGSDGTQVENSSSSVPSSIEFDLETYETGGVSGTVLCVVPLWRLGTSSTASSNGGTGRLFANPDSGADDTLDFEGAGETANTEPTGWLTQRGAYVDSPSVTLDVAPELRLTKTVSTTRVHSCSFMGLYVEYDPTATGPEESDFTPSGIAIGVTMGTPVTDLETDYTPSGIAVGVTMGSPVTDLETTLSLSGISIPVTFGSVVLGTLFDASLSGIAISVALGSPTLDVETDFTPSGIAIPVTLGSLVTDLETSLTPSGISIPVTFGDLMIDLETALTLSGISIPVTLGSPAFEVISSLDLSGIAIPVTLGSPEFELALLVELSGISIPVTLGDLTFDLETSLTPSGISIPVTMGTIVLGTQLVRVSSLEVHFAGKDALVEYARKQKLLQFSPSGLTVIMD